MAVMVVMERDDLVNLICGVQPSYALFSELKDYGTFYDNRGWEWKKGALKCVDDGVLLDMYYKVRDSWEVK